MNFINKLIVLSIVIYSVSFTTIADNHTPVLIPLEVQQCNFNEKKDMDDFLNLIGEWNDLLDDHSEYPYSGWVLTPQYRTSSDFSFDFAWVGVSDSWSNFGNIYDVWLEKGAKLGAKFEKIRSCKTQNLFASQAVRVPEVSSESSVLLVSNCKLNEGSTLLDVAVADAKWNDYLDSTGSAGGIYRWFPGLGAPSDIDFDFKNVLVSSSMAEWGASSDTYVNGGGFGLQAEIYGDVVFCDSARMYQSNNMRDVRD